MYKNKFLSLLLVFSLVICGTMGTGKGAKAEENVTTEESGSVEEEEPCEEPEEDIDLKVNITAMWDHHYNAEVVDEDEVDLDKISIGCRVKIRDLEFNEDLDYKIVGSTEANSLKGKISNESPVGKALIGHKVRDIVEVETQAGVLKYEVLEIQRSN